MQSMLSIYLIDVSHKKLLKRGYTSFYQQTTTVCGESKEKKKIWRFQLAIVALIGCRKKLDLKDIITERSIVIGSKRRKEKMRIISLEHRKNQYY